MSNVVINLNFGGSRTIGPVSGVRQRSLAIEPESHPLEPEMVRYLIYEGLTALDLFQYRATAKGKGKAGKQCKTGQACGNTCISKTKTCKKGLSGAQQQKAKTAKAKTAAKGKAGMAGGQEQPQPPANADQSGAEQPPTLKATSYNPSAIPDLTPGDFRKYLDDKEKLRQQDDPTAIHNKTLDQAKAESKYGYTKSKYVLDIKNAIGYGFVPSDEALKDVKLTKSEQNQLEQNRKEVADRRQNAKRIDDAIDHPLMTEEESKNYKPSMSREEANTYTKDSFIGNISIWHGNRLDVTDSIANDGMQPEKNNRGIFGKGGYFAVSKDIAEDYVYSADLEERYPQKGLIESKAKVKNPYVVTEAEMEKLTPYFPGDQFNSLDSTAMTNYLRARGHDSIYLKDYGYVVTFDQKQSVTVNYEKIDRGSQRDKEIAGKWEFGKGTLGSKGSIDERKAASAVDKNHQALEKAKQTDEASKIERYS